VETSKLARLIDANLNRLREGVRVVEDICRYIYDDKTFASKLKELRHTCRIEDETALLEARDVHSDVLKATTQSESRRHDIKQLITANLKRAQEAARVLEETLKIYEPQSAQKFKKIRYDLYEIEATLQKTPHHPPAQK
jgi:thiamine-phosphate pyrophosphorylase